MWAAADCVHCFVIIYCLLNSLTEICRGLTVVFRNPPRATHQAAAAVVSSHVPRGTLDVKQKCSQCNRCFYIAANCFFSFLEFLVHECGGGLFVELAAHVHQRMRHECPHEAVPDDIYGRTKQTIAYDLQYPNIHTEACVRCVLCKPDVCQAAATVNIPSTPASMAEPQVSGGTPSAAIVPMVAMVSRRKGWAEIQ